MRVLLAAGGTGGHLFPAQAVASGFAAHGHRVELVTDRRAEPFLPQFSADAVHMVPAATPRVKNPLVLARAVVTLALAEQRCMGILKKARPDVAIGFGGYPTVPPLRAARRRDVPRIIHEANAVPGKANRYLAAFCHVFTAFGDFSGKALSVTRVGMPVRPAVLDAQRDYERPGERLSVLIFGGSQGARVFADRVPEALAGLDTAARARLAIVQQCRPEDMERVRAAYDDAGIEAELAPFFADLPARMAAAHLVVCRSGASTVAELSVIGRPALLVPLPGALDQDQLYNAKQLEAAGGGIAIPQDAFTPERLRQEIGRALAEPQRLEEMAAAAKAFGRPDAVERFVAATEALVTPAEANAA